MVIKKAFAFIKTSLLGVIRISAWLIVMADACAWSRARKRGKP